MIAFRDPPYAYVALAKDCGFEVVTLTEQDSPRKTFFLEIRKLALTFPSRTRDTSEIWPPRSLSHQISSRQ